MALSSFLKSLRDDYLFRILFLLVLILSILSPGKIVTYPSLVDWPVIATLAGLLLLTKSLELSGYLMQVGKRLVASLPTERALALFLIAITALLSMFLTNDVALFVVVPLTLGLRATTELPIARLVVFEALAANAGSAFTPIGNPQNLFLWQLSHVQFYAYCTAMLPLLAILMGLLLLLGAIVFSANALSVREEPAPVSVSKKLLSLSLVLYLPFLVLADFHFSLYALPVVLLVFWIAERRVLLQTDWGLILVFVLMFVDLRLLAQLQTVRTVIEAINLAHPQRLYFAGIVASQFISNVPSAILLAEYTKDWRLIAYAVNVGGFGFVMGSLANIIALRMARKHRAWLLFHAYSVPFLLVAGVLIYLYLFVMSS